MHIILPFMLCAPMRHPDACFIASHNALIIRKCEEVAKYEQPQVVPIMQFKV